MPPNMDGDLKSKTQLPEGGDLVRIVNNFFRVGTGDQYRAQDVETLKVFADYAGKRENTDLKKFKVALVCICLNENYWPFLKDMVEGAKKFFLPGHDVDVLCWSDMKGVPEGATVFETEPVEWPMPTLMRYHLFLQQEEKLKEYDYVFYCDADMLFVNYVGDEILGEGLTAAQHPMYALRKEFYAPFEPNPESKAYFPFPKNYYAGGFQGGKTADFIKAMKEMRKAIDYDFAKNYTARWNDESHWNRYLLDRPPSIVLHPGYIYPDSLINEYYLKVWGRDYPAKIVTLTKKFSLSSEGGSAVTDMIKTL